MTTTKAKSFISGFLAIAILASAFPNQSVLAAKPIDPGPSVKFSTDMVGFKLTGTYTAPGGQPNGTGLFPSNNTGGNLGPYPEGSCLPASINVSNDKNEAGDANFEIVFDYKHQGNPTDVVGIESLKQLTAPNIVGSPRTADNLDDFSFSGNDLTSADQFPASSGTVSGDIFGPYSGSSGTSTVSDNDSTRHYVVNLTAVPGKATVYMLFCAQLGLDAGQFPGASLSVSPQGTGGGGNLSVTVSTILTLPSLTIQKTVVGGTAQPSDFSFYVNPMINGQSTFTIPVGSNSLTINNITVDHDYTVQENASAANYTFTSGNGTHCVFDGGIATAGLYASTTPINALCNFTNTYSVPFVATTGTVTVIQKIINDNGGTATLDDFTSTLNYDSTVLPITGGATSTFTLTAPVTYWLSYPMNVPGYMPTYEGDCSQNLAVGQHLTCTITYNDDPIVVPPGTTTSTVTVIKRVVNDNGGTKQPGDFTLHMNASSTDFDFAGNSGGTLITIPAGDYTVTEATDPDYSATSTSGCSGTAQPGENRICTFTNTYIPKTGTITIIKNVINNDGGVGQAADFTLTLTSSSTDPVSVQGSTTGVTQTLPIGRYMVTENNPGTYNVSYSAGCSGDLQAGASMVCTVTNDDPTQGGGGFEQTTSTITIIKQVVGGSAKPSDFTFSLYNNTDEPSLVEGNASGTTKVIQAGTYRVSENESEISGYVPEYSNGCTGTTTAGQSIECIVTNRYQEQNGNGTIVVIKRISNPYSQTVVPASYFRLNATYHLADGGNEKLVAGATTTVSFPGDENGTRLTAGPGAYTVTEPAYEYWRTEYSEGCTGILEAGATVTCTVTNVAIGGGGGSGSNGGGGWSPGILSGSTPSTPTNPAPTPRVLGVEDDQPSLCLLTETEASYITPDVNTLLNHLGITRDTAKEEYFNRVLVTKVVPKEVDPAVLSSVQNFVSYGTLDTQHLGEGERAGVVNSFRAFHGHLPGNDCEWQEVIRIANTKLPGELDQAYETNVLQTTFPEIYKRPATSTNLDTIAKQMMAYGIRPKVRDLRAEYEATKVFKKIYKKLPSTAREWDANRAIAYSGLPHKLLAVDLTKSPSRILEIMAANTSLALK